MATRVRDIQQPLSILSLNVRGLTLKTHHINILIRKYKPDFLCLQETNIDNKHKEQTVKSKLEIVRGIFNYPDTHCNGTAILQTSANWEIQGVNKTLAGRVTTVNITNKNDRYSLTNIYAPSKTQFKDIFYTELKEHLISNTIKHNNIILGDFNTTIEEKDIIGYRGDNRPGRYELKQIVTTLDLQDTFRRKYPDKIDYTFKHKPISQATRLDRAYVSDNIFIEDHIHLEQTLTFTDHKGILVNLGHIQVRSNAPHWKFNDSLLENEEFQKAIKIAIEFSKLGNKISINKRMDNLRESIKEIAKYFGSVIKKEREETLKLLETFLIQAPNLKNENPKEYREIKDRIQEIYDIIYKGAQIRSKLNMVEEPSKLFLNAENIVQKSRLITEITDMQQRNITDLTEIPAAFREYYMHLYSREDTDPDVQKTYLKYCKKLKDEDRDVIDQDITVTDLRKALDGMDETSSPGPNGLTVNFYKTFFNDLAPLLELLVKESFEKEGISDYLNKAYISLLPKDSGPLTDMKNYRPISLLNVEYKMITKALATKVSTFLGTIVNPDQAAAIKDRNIQNHIHLIRDIITLAHDRQDSNLMLSVDQQKAFDRVCHIWLQKVLEQNNFGPKFRRWVRLLYANASSHILVNQTLSDAFELGRGVRQGDPLSMMLYVLTLEPLLESIRQDSDVTGFSIPGHTTQKLLAFADDTNFFPKTTRSVRRIIEHFKLFEKASGSKINTSKSQAMGLGKWNNIKEIEGIKWVKKLKVFGLYFTNDREQQDKAMWKNLILKTEKLTDMFSFKSASIFGRAILVNSIIEPKFIYPATVFDPPKKIIKKYQTITRNFVLRGGITNIKQKILIQEKLNGGINLHDLDIKIKSLRLKHFKNFLKNKTPIMEFYLAPYITEYSSFNNKKPRFYGVLPKFYQNLKKNIRENTELLKISNTKLYYKKLIESESVPLIEPIKRADESTNLKSIFKNLHTIRGTKNYDKQILYKLIFNITPTSENKPIRLNKCKICNKYKETEEHIFYSCPELDLIKTSLLRLLRLPINTFKELYQGIFLGITTQNSDTSINHYRQTLLHIYRHICWGARVSATFKNTTHTAETLNSTFIAQSQKFILDKVDENTLAKL